MLKVNAKSLSNLLYQTTNVLIDEEFEQHRWYTTRRAIVSFGGMLIEFFYNEPSTEEIEVEDEFVGFDKETELVECFEVEPYQVSVTHYRRK